MKKLLSNTRFALVLTFIFLSVFSSTALAQRATSDEINKAIVSEKSLPLTWVNKEGKKGWIVNNKTLETTESGDSLKFTYTSSRPTLVEFYVTLKKSYSSSSVFLA